MKRTAMSRRRAGASGGDMRFGLGPALVLREFVVDPNDPNGSPVRVTGRASGFFAWLLTVLKLDATTSLLLTAQTIVFRSSSLFGQHTITIPLSKVASTSCGYSKPIGALIFAAVMVFTGLGALSQRDGQIVLAICLAAALISMIIYALGKKLFVTVESVGSTRVGLAFKRSLIENVPVDIDRVQHAIDIINDRVQRSP